MRSALVDRSVSSDNWLSPEYDLFKLFLCLAGRINSQQSSAQQHTGMPAATRRTARTSDQDEAPAATAPQDIPRRTRRQVTQSAAPAVPPPSMTARTVSSVDQPRGFAGLSGNFFPTFVRFLLNIETATRPHAPSNVGTGSQQTEQRTGLSPEKLYLLQLTLCLLEVHVQLLMSIPELALELEGLAPVCEQCCSFCVRSDSCRRVLTAFTKSRTNSIKSCRHGMLCFPPQIRLISVTRPCHRRLLLVVLRIDWLVC